MSTTGRELHRFQISAAEAGERLDHALARALRCSHGEARRLLDAGVVRIAGRSATRGDKGRRVAAGEVIEVLGQTDRIEPTDAPELSVLAEGEGWIIVDKPAGAPVHPLRPGETGTVLNAVAARYPRVQGVGEPPEGGGLRSGVIHRLDVETSGALAVALDADAWRRWRDAFNARAVDKQYLALVAGRLEGERHETLPLAVVRHRPAVVRVVELDHPGARACDLTWRSLAASDAASLLSITLGTGFLHQIRVMLAHRGHPLLGDAHYGGPVSMRRGDTAAPVQRPMLHASRLRWDAIDASAPLPDDFATLMRTLRLDPPDPLD